MDDYHKEKEGENVNRKIKKYLDEIDKTEKKIEELFYTLESIQDKSEREELIKKLTDAIAVTDLNASVHVTGNRDGATCEAYTDALILQLQK